MKYKTITPDMIVSKAREYLGVPWVHQGRDKTKGVDCSGFVINIYEELTGEELSWLPKDYARVVDGPMMRAWCDFCLDRVHDRQPQPGDILLLRIRREPQHLAVVTDYGIIHAHQGVGKVVETRLDERWRKRIVEVYRFKEVQ